MLGPSKMKLKKSQVVVVIIFIENNNIDLNNLSSTTELDRRNTDAK